MCVCVCGIRFHWTQTLCRTMRWLKLQKIAFSGKNGGNNLTPIDSENDADGVTARAHLPVVALRFPERRLN